MSKQTLIDEVLDVVFNRDRRDPVQSVLEIWKDYENMHKDPVERIGEIVRRRFDYAASRMIRKLLE